MVEMVVADNALVCHPIYKRPTRMTEMSQATRSRCALRIASGSMADFGESGIGEDAAATHVELSPDYVLTGFGDNRITLDGTSTRHGTRTLSSSRG